MKKNWREISAALSAIGDMKSYIDELKSVYNYNGDDEGNYVVTSAYFFTKEQRALNRELGLRNINNFQN